MAKVKKPAARKSAKRKPAKKKLAAKPARKPARKIAAPKKPAAVARPKRPAGFPEQLRDAALKVLDDRQAEEIFTVDLAGRSSVADYLIIASGRASKQLTAIAHYLRDAFMKLGIRQVRIEGVGEGNWVLVDSGDVIVHLFRPEVRRYYNLERIWDADSKK